MKKLFVLMLPLITIAGCANTAATGNDATVSEPKEEKQYVTGRLTPTKDKSTITTTTGAALIGTTPNSAGKTGN